MYHFSVKPISRSDGRSATAAIAYRSGTQVIDARTGLIHDYSNKRGVLYTEIVLPENAPAWAHDREQLWNEVEFSEKRKNSTVAREIIVALPHELSPAARAELVLKFVHELVKRHGFAAEVCIHAPDGEGDNRNHHAHILLTTRRLESTGFTDKIRELDAAKTGSQIIKEWRGRWAQLQNDALELAGSNARVDHRTLAEQGITDRLPGWHQGSATTAMQREGKKTDFEVRREAAEAEFQANIECEAAAQAQLEIDRLNALMAELQAQAAAEAELEAIQRQKEHEEAVRLTNEAFLKRISWDIDHIDEAHHDDEDTTETLADRAFRLRAEARRLEKLAAECRRPPTPPTREKVKFSTPVKISSGHFAGQSFALEAVRELQRVAEVELSNRQEQHAEKGFFGRLVESKELKTVRDKLIEVNELGDTVERTLSTEKGEKFIDSKLSGLLSKFNDELESYRQWDKEVSGVLEACAIAAEAEREARLERERLHPELAAQERAHNHGLSM